VFFLPQPVVVGSFLPVAVDDDGAVVRKIDGKQLRRRLLFASDPT